MNMERALVLSKARGLALQIPFGALQISELGRGQGGLESPVLCGQVAEEGQRRTKSCVWPLQGPVNEHHVLPIPPTLSVCSWCALEGAGAAGPGVLPVPQLAWQLWEGGVCSLEATREAVRLSRPRATRFSIWLPRKLERSCAESNDTLRTLLSFPYHMADKATRKPWEERGGCGHPSVCPGPVSYFIHQTPPVFPIF